MSEQGKDWNPALYLAYEEERTQPARDLLAGVRLKAPASIVDLGCGPGNSTELLCRRYESASVPGLDSSPSMITAARKRVASAQFELGYIVDWSPAAPVDLLYANASLQLVDSHETLFPILLSYLKPGGVLAVQMPDNHDEPTHRLMKEVSGHGPWAARIASSVQLRTKTLTLADYYDLLAPSCAHIQIWCTTYIHVLASVRAIVEWLQGTGLRPFLAPLPDDECAAFLSAYAGKLANAYPLRPDGRILCHSLGNSWWRKYQNRW